MNIINELKKYNKELRDDVRNGEIVDFLIDLFLPLVLLMVLLLGFILITALIIESCPILLVAAAIAAVFALALWNFYKLTDNKK